MRVALDPELGRTRTETLSLRRDHFSQLLNRHFSVCRNAVRLKPELARVPDMAEVEKTVHQMCNGKTAGSEGLPAELFKHCGTTLDHAILSLTHSIWYCEVVPQKFKDVLIVPLYTGNGSKLVMDDYSGIILLNCTGKLVARILLNSEKFDGNVAEEQCGFRSGRSTIDLVFAARQTQEKFREYNQLLCGCVCGYHQSA